QDTLTFLNDYIATPSLHAFEEFTASKGLTLSSQDLINPQEALQISVDSMREYRTAFLNAPVIIGASGAVFGVLLAFGVLFPNTPLYLMFIPIPIKAKWFVLGYGLIELFSGIKGSVDDNVAHFAHLGGMLFGFILLKYWQRQKTNFY
ncbi:MAG TPA: rhomboid family intramembrane serine protease, partial [Bacteroidia bacterium]|nr:rhomboid family intramembrane serine protease [Bacteroidia bacterium]